MLTFIVSVILVSFICLCFFKKNFWENRYLVLLISGGVALIATLAINFSVRGKLQTKTEIVWNKPLCMFYLPDSIFKDSLKTPFIKNYDYYVDHKAKEFDKDSTKKQIPVTILIYKPKGKHTDIYIGTLKRNGNQGYYHLDKVYLTQSSVDTVAYVSKKKLYYDVKPNNWITGFSLPRKSTITILYIPPKEFAMIPDSLIRKIPF